MRHKVRKGKLNRTSEHRKVLFSNMATSLIIHEQIETTLPKAKVLRPIIEKLITKGKKGGLHNRRQILQLIHDDEALKKLMSTLATRYSSRNGGYTRIIRSGFRYGDDAPKAIIEFVDRDVMAKGKLDKERYQHELKDKQDVEASSGIVG